MKRVLKWIGVVLGAILGLIILAVAAVYLITGLRMNKTYDVAAEPITVPADEETIAWGEHVATIRACNGCHGENMGGDTLVENTLIGKFYPSNLTAGQGGVLDNYSDALLARAVRHGIGYDDKPLLVMPAHEFKVLSDEDLGAVIAYIRSRPAVDHEQPGSSPGPLARVLYLTGAFPLLPAELIDHDVPRPAAPERAVTAEYGAYLATVCQSCHGEDYAGGSVPGASPDTPPAANLTPGGELAGWTQEGFMNTVRTGVTPSGRQLDDFMPWKQFSNMTDDELAAVWLFLQSLPAREQGN
jgi:mono/diheme cytochrome c family protein